jgi:hypothetical protein
MRLTATGQKRQCRFMGIKYAQPVQRKDREMLRPVEASHDWATVPSSP